MPGRWRPFLVVPLLLIATEAVYFRFACFRGASLVGSDYFQLHMLRLEFAQEAIFGDQHSVPAWYPRELLGAPFAANLQSFPLIPTRLILLFFEPASAYYTGIAIAAALAALFTYLYCRRVGISEIGSAAAGWTFACSGFFASRVMAGHLPLLEAYPALPLLLWLTDRALDSARDPSTRRDLFALAAATACIAVAGHPQLPFYSILVAILYVVFCGRGRKRIQAVLAMALGATSTLAAWIPMFLLMGRSTRVLHLAPPSNDIAMPLRRLASLVIPEIDGWASPLARAAKKPFIGYPDPAYFWDTTSYIGWMPLVMIAAILVWGIQTKRWPNRRWRFLIAIGLGALIFSLRIVNPVRDMIPGTFLRSPARLLYISTFVTAIALGWGISAIAQSGLFSGRIAWAVAGLLVAAHAFDLGSFSRQFIQVTTLPVLNPVDSWTREIWDSRVAAQTEFSTWYRERLDDVGILDSILLTNPYRAVLGLSGAPPDFNTQVIDGDLLSIPALQAAGVALVITSNSRSDLQRIAQWHMLSLYSVPDTWPRAAFFPADRLDFAPVGETLDRFLLAPRRDRLLLPSEDRNRVPAASSSVADPSQADVRYSRPSSDVIVVVVGARGPGAVHVLESCDPGWSAIVDGLRAPVILANGYSMAVPVGPGKHSVELRYHTPGRKLGWIFSVLSAGLLAILIWKAGWPAPVN